MQGALIALAVCACSEPAKQPDALVGCPPLGVKPPFGGATELARMTWYSATATFAIAMRDGQVVDGTGTPLTIEPAAALDIPRLAPDGDDVFARAGTELRRYRRDGTRLVLQATLTTDLALTDFEHSAPTAGSPRRMMVREGIRMFELVESAPDTWTTADFYILDHLDLEAFDQPQLSPDGRRVVMRAQQAFDTQLRYFDRPSVTDRLAHHGVLVRTNGGMHPFMTDDCARLYFSIGDATHVAER